MGNNLSIFLLISLQFGGFGKKLFDTAKDEFFKDDNKPEEEEKGGGFSIPGTMTLCIINYMITMVN